MENLRNIDNIENHYDYLVVGAGIFGAVFAHEMAQIGKKVLVIDQRNHIAGNAYTESIAGIEVHVYGPHIFHTSNERIWSYVNRFTQFNRFINQPLAYYQGRMYNLPFNMNTFQQLWGVTTPEEAKQRLKDEQSKSYQIEPKNLEEQAINLVGRDIYEKLIQGYTEKQWGKSCKDLPPFIIKRLPVRFTYNNNYFNDIYQGIPVGGYTQMIEFMLEGIDIVLNVDYLKNKDIYDAMADKVLFTGCIDAFYNYQFGMLEYRSLRFEHAILDIDNFQGNAVINYTDKNIPFTRIVEHKHFAFGTQPKTVITREFSDAHQAGKIPFYPINNEVNQALYARYRTLADQEDKYLFGGRLAEYRYADMDQIILSALVLSEKESH
jgi:UDP-galactopyranose mutase